MTLAEQAAQRADLARQRGREPLRWIAGPGAAAELSDASGQLLGLPVEVGVPRSEWGLELVCAGRG